MKGSRGGCEQGTFLCRPSPFETEMKPIQNSQLAGLLEDILGDELEAFIEWMSQPLPNSIRINTLKVERDELIGRLESQGFRLKPLDFYDAAFRVEHEPFPIGKTLEHFLGHFYVQELASMIPPLVLEPKPGEKVLDIAAAPGSKTTQMAQMMENTGVIVANDVNIDRIRALSHNIDRLGVLNTIITEFDGYKFGFLTPNIFDKVLIDAPCSALGTLHRSPEVARWWSWGRVGMLVRTQRALILAGYQALKPGGVMVYSTCTLVPEENEGTVDFLLSRHPEAEVLPFQDFGFKMDEALVGWRRKTYDPKVKAARRLYPHRNKTEGFFIAKIRKPT